MNLSRYTNEELQAELERRRQKQGQLPKPQMLQMRNFHNLQNLCQRYIDELAEDGYVDEDLEDHIFEAALEAFYGRDVWVFINRTMRG